MTLTGEAGRRQRCAQTGERRAKDESSNLGDRDVDSKCGRCIRRVLDLGLDIEQFKDPHACRHSSLQLAILHGQLADRFEKALDP